MPVEFITMAIILVVLLLFSVLILRSLANAADIRVRRDMKRLLQTYDKVIDSKCAEIQELSDKKAKLEKDISALQSPPVPEVAETQSGSAGGAGESGLLPKATYRSSVLGAGYESIRKSFQMDALERDQLIREVEVDGEATHRNRGEKAAKLLGQLPFDTVFRLSQLTNSDQLAILDETLNDNDWTLLRDYYEERPDTPFDVTAFWDWLKDIARMESDSLEVYCGDMLACQKEGLIYQQQICEGIQIRTGNRIYDYSIKEREIS